MTHATDQHYHGWCPECKCRTTAPYTGWEGPRCAVCTSPLGLAELHPAHWAASLDDESWRSRVGERFW